MRWPILFCSVLLWLGGLGTAMAAPSPYADWKFDLKRAERTARKAGNIEMELSRLAELTTAEPGFARIWMYGQLYDLVTPGISEAVRAGLRPRFKRIAETLNKGETPDPRPALLLDRAHAAEGATPRLVKQAEQSRAIETSLLDLLRNGNSLPARMVAAEYPEVAEVIFHSLLHRAELASHRMSGMTEHAFLVAAARRVAEGAALAHGDLNPWRTLRAFMGGKKVSDPSDAVLDQLLSNAFEARIQGDSAKAKTLLDTALLTARASRGHSVLATMVLSGVAHAAEWNGDAANARALRTQVLQSVRTLNRPALTATMVELMVRGHLADKTVDEMVAHTRDLRESGAPAVSSVRNTQTLMTASVMLRETAEARIAAGDLPGAVRLLAEADAIATTVATEEAVAATTPTTQTTETLRQRRLAMAQIQRVRGRLAVRRGDTKTARTIFEAVRGLYLQLDERGMAGETGLDLANVWLMEGRYDEALESAHTAKDHLGPHAPAIQRAKISLALGQARLIRGQIAPAFAHANAGLTLVLNDATAVPVRAALHHLAGLALDAAGYLTEAQVRLDTATRLAPERLQFQLSSAQSLARAGRYDAALKTTDAVRSVDPKQAAAMRGCLLSRAGRHREAAAILTRLLPQFSQAHQLGAHLSARTCLAHAQLSAGNVAGARRTLSSARRALKKHPDPMLTWRVAALEGRIAWSSGRRKAAAAAWIKALDGFRDVRNERPDRGVTLDTRTLALPVAPDMALRTLPDALAATGQQPEALRYALWARRLKTAPHDRVEARVARRPAAELPGGGLVGQLVHLRALLRDDKVVRDDRAALQATLKTTADALHSAETTLAASAPAWVERYTPAPNGPPSAGHTLELFYAIGQTRGHLWVRPKGQAMRHYNLPGAADLEARLAPMRTALKTPPAVWAPQEKHPKDPNAEVWATLAQPVSMLLPFLSDSTLGPLAAELDWQILADGPLLDFPLEALVLVVPSPELPGAAPVFLGGRHTVTYRTPPQVRPSVAAPAKPASVFGPLPTGEGCPTGLNGGCAELAEDALAFAAGFKSAGTTITVIEREDASAAGLATALNGHSLVYLASPVDLVGGALLTAPKTKSGPYERLEGANLGFDPVHAQTVVLARISNDAPNRALGFLRLAEGLHAAGISKILRVLGPTDPKWAGLLGAELGKGTPLSAALLNLRSDLMGTVVDPIEGGPALHHPFYWMRSMLFVD